VLESLKKRTYYPADIEAATDGYVDRKTQQSWHARKKWLTPTATPMGGKPREYRLEHVLEAAILATCVQYGLTLDQGRQAIHRRLMYVALEKSQQERGSSSFFEGDVREAVFDLPEFQKADQQSPIWWAIYMDRGIAPPRNPASVVGVRVIYASTTTQDIMDKAVAVVLLDITKIKNEVTRVLLERTRTDDVGDED